MAGRTNKRGIAKNKAQQKKQANRLKGGRRFDYPKRSLSLDEAKELGIVGVMTNPLNKTYHWFLRGRMICWETRLRTDPDGFRYVKLPSGGSNIVQTVQSGYIRKKLKKSVSNR